MTRPITMSSVDQVFHGFIRPPRRPVSVEEQRALAGAERRVVVHHEGLALVAWCSGAGASVLLRPGMKALTAMAAVVAAAVAGVGCSDGGVGEPGATATTPPRFTPAIEIMATVNGVAAQPPLVVKDRDKVVLQSSVPVEWVTSPGGATAESVISTSTSWRGTLRYRLPLSAGMGPYSVRALTIASSQAARVTVPPATPQASRVIHIIVTP